MKEFDQTNAPAMGLEGESLDWVNRLLSGAVTWDEAEAFKTWRATSPAHEAAFAEAVRFRRSMRRAILTERKNPSATATIFSPARTIGKPQSIAGLSRRSVLGGALAASAAGYLVVRPPSGLWPSWSELTSDYRTRTGERRQIATAQGVSLELNTQTSIARRSNATPEIELVSGEAAVSAQRPPNTPFTVVAGTGHTLLADGAVDIRNLGASVCVTCLHGDAEVIHPAGHIRLSGGAQIAYTDQALAPVRTIDVALVTAWRKGLLIFRDAPLQQVVDELNRYRPGKIVLTDAALARRPVYGVFQLREIARSVEQVQHLTGARATHLPGGIVFLS